MSDDGFDYTRKVRATAERNNVETQTDTTVSSYETNLLKPQSWITALRINVMSQNPDGNVEHDQLKMANIPKKFRSFPPYPSFSWSKTTKYPVNDLSYIESTKTLTLPSQSSTDPNIHDYGDMEDYLENLRDSYPQLRHRSIHLSAYPWETNERDEVEISRYNSIFDHPSDESTFLQEVDLNVKPTKEFCSTVLCVSEQEQDMLEVIACMNESTNSELGSNSLSLDERPESTVKKYLTQIPFCQRMPNVTKAMNYITSNCELCFTRDILFPEFVDTIEYTSGFTITRSSTSGLYETIDAQSIGLLGSLATFEGGFVTALDVATEIIGALLRTDLELPQEWYYHPPLVREIQADNAFIDCCFLVNQPVKNVVSGNKMIASGFVLFITKRNEIRVEEYCVTCR
jgi:hypothetical protein